MMQRARSPPKFGNLDLRSFNGSKSMEHGNSNTRSERSQSPSHGSPRENLGDSCDEQWGRSPAKQQENQDNGANLRFGEEEEEEGMIGS